MNTLETTKSTGVIAPARAILFDDTILLVPTKALATSLLFFEASTAVAIALAIEEWSTEWSGEGDCESC